MSFHTICWPCLELHPPQPHPGIPDPLLRHCPPTEVWRCTIPPTPNTLCIIIFCHQPPIIIFPWGLGGWFPWNWRVERLSPETLFFPPHPQALPLDKSLLLAPLCSQSASILSIITLGHTHTLQTPPHDSPQSKLHPVWSKAVDHLVTEGWKMLQMTVPFSCVSSTSFLIQIYAISRLQFNVMLTCVSSVCVCLWMQAGATRTSSEGTSQSANPVRCPETTRQVSTANYILSVYRAISQKPEKSEERTSCLNLLLKFNA